MNDAAKIAASHLRRRAFIYTPLTPEPEKFWDR